jgi:hypothetical protein
VIVKPPESEQHIKGKALQPELGEVFPDAWERFERAVHVMAKAGPQHRQRPHDERKERPASKGRVHKGKSRA